LTNYWLHFEKNKNVALEHPSVATNPVFETSPFDQIIPLECTFATTMNQTNIKTHYNDAGTTQAAKRARTEEQEK